MKLTVPDRIKKGDTIGFVSPSAGLAPFAMHRIERARDFFQKLGFGIKIAKNALKNNGYVSASIEDRVSDLHEMFADPKVRMIMATIGGDHSNQLLKYLDYDLIRNNPKIFVGYSDISVLHYAIQSQSGLATYFGPCAMTQFGEYPEPLKYTANYFNDLTSQGSSSKLIDYKTSDSWTDEVLNWFEKKDNTRPRKLYKNSGYQWPRAGKAEGFLLGGTIPSINHLLGTKYWIDPQGAVFFIDIPEGVSISEGLSISSADSCLADLDNVGVFEKINGLVVGRPYHYTQEETETLKKIILNYASDSDYPVLFNANIGHCDPIITLRYGARAILNSEENYFAAES